jgi:hypothetical protein
MVLAALLIAAAIIPPDRLTAQSGCDSRDGREVAGAPSVKQNLHT